MIDINEKIDAVDRTVSGAGEARTVTLSQVYDTDVADLWDACTNAERIPRWFLPVTGDLRVGGRYQLEGNAGGTVESCDPPHGFRATWEFGGNVSWIEVRLTPESDGRARFTLAHTLPVDAHWEEFGPGAVGIGFDLALIGLTLHLATKAPVDSVEVMTWSASDEGRAFMTRSSEGWRVADIASGTDAAVADAAAARTLAAYTATE